MKMTDRFTPAGSTFLTLVILATVNCALSSTACPEATKGQTSHYFDDVQETVFTAECGQLCPLPLSNGSLQVINLKVTFPFPTNLTRTTCSWVLPGFPSEGDLSTVMFFEQDKQSSLSNKVVCGEATPSLSLWDEYSEGGQAQTTYSICWNEGEVRPEAYSRRSSRLGGGSTLITLTDFDVSQQLPDLTLLKYVTVDWSQDCFADYHEVKIVEDRQHTLTLGSQWFTTRLRLPNGMHCRWKFSTTYRNYMIQVRVAVTDSTSIPGSCVNDDYVEMAPDMSGGEDKQRFHLCDDSPPAFFFSLTGSVFVDFVSGAAYGAPGFEFTLSDLDICPESRAMVVVDLVENVVWGLSDPNYSHGPCLWELRTPRADHVVMVTRLDGGQHVRDCSRGDYLSMILGGGTFRKISLCEQNLSLSTPLWARGQSMYVDLHDRPTTSRHTVGVFFKSVPHVPACQGIPVQLEAERKRQKSVVLDLGLHRLHRDVSAPDCRWTVQPSCCETDDANAYVAKLVLSDSAVPTHQRVLNTTGADWLVSGFRAYAGTSANASFLLTPYCSFLASSVQCVYRSTSHYLLLVYDPTLSTSPSPFDKVRVSFEQMVKPTSGQAGSVWRCCSWHAQFVVMVVLVLFGRLW